MVTPESQRVNHYIRGLAPEIKPHVTSSKPATIQGVVSMANRLTTDGIKDGLFKKKENAGKKRSKVNENVSMLVNIRSVQNATSIILVTAMCVIDVTKWATLPDTAQAKLLMKDQGQLALCVEILTTLGGTVWTYAPTCSLDLMNRVYHGFWIHLSLADVAECDRTSVLSLLTLYRIFRSTAQSSSSKSGSKLSISSGTGPISVSVCIIEVLAARVRVGLYLDQLNYCSSLLAIAGSHTISVYDYVAALLKTSVCLQYHPECECKDASLEILPFNEIVQVHVIILNMRANTICDPLRA
ncbi:hypothetical protein Tco_1345725 [Tanacetum coccineum]